MVQTDSGKTLLFGEYFLPFPRYIVKSICAEMTAQGHRRLTPMLPLERSEYDFIIMIIATVLLTSRCSHRQVQNRYFSYLVLHSNPLRETVTNIFAIFLQFSQVSDSSGRVNIFWKQFAVYAQFTRLTDTQTQK